MKFRVGNVVTVVSETSFWNMQGVIKQIDLNAKDGHSIGVEFGHPYKHMWGYVFNENGNFSCPSKMIIWHRPDQLKIDEWRPEVLADNLFGKRLWHTLCTRKKPFSKESDCEVGGCAKKTDRRIMINVWGVVEEVDVCQQHAERYHGKILDDFSDFSRKNKQEAA